MKKFLIVTGAIVAAGLLARRGASACGGVDFEQMIERMPENAPPKWMYRNITAIRENTEQTVSMLEAERRHAVTI